MPKPIRDTDPEKYHMVTIRSAGAALWLIPTAELNEIVGGIFARYQEQCGVIIYACIVLGNHYHLVVKAPNQNLDEFEENVNRELSRRVNFLHKRSGSLWGRPYDDRLIVTEEDLLNAVVYTVTNAAKHGLVLRPEEWPGFSTYNQSMTEEDRTFSFTHYSKWDPKTRRPLITKHTLKISPLPQFAHLPKQERIQALKERVEGKLKAIVEKRGGKFLGVRAVVRQSPGSIPLKVATAPRKPYYTSCPIRETSFKVQIRERRKEYSHASFEYRRGNLDVEFPIHSFKPPLHRRSRTAHFTLAPPFEKITA